MTSHPHNWASRSISKVGGTHFPAALSNRPYAEDNLLQDKGASGGVASHVFPQHNNHMPSVKR